MNRYSAKTHILLFVVLGVLLYWYTLPYPFVFDSRFYLVDNPLITDSGMFLRLLDIPAFAKAFTELDVHRDVVVTFILRPFSNLTFHLNYLLDGFDPEGYRVVNIAIHICNAILWYALLARIIRHRNGVGSAEQQWFIPFFSTLFFLVHPLNTESVTYTIQRYTSLGTLFYLATMLLFMASLLSSTRRQRLSAYIGSVITLVVGMLSQENLITAPITLVLMGVILLRLPPRTVLLRASAHICCLPIIPLLVYLISRAQAEGQKSLSNISRVIDGYPPYEYAITQSRAILTYFRMLVAPYGQNIDPSYPLYRSFAEPEIIISLTILALFVIAGVMLQSGKRRSLHNDLLSFCIFFSLLALSVSSSFFPLPDLMTEHRGYLFSLPAITGLVCRIDSLRPQFSPLWATRLIILLAVVAAMYSALTVKRNLLYSSSLALWQDSVSKSPDKWRPNYNAGVAAIDEQQYQKAIPFFRRSIQISPYKIEGYSNLGSTYLALADFHSAISAYLEGLAVGGDSPVLLVNLGNAYRQAGQLQDAIEVLEKSVQANPYLIMPYRILAELYAGLGHREKALQNVRMARELDSGDHSLVLLEEEILKLK
ncbi:MAG: tetratricopeptide repeat protein [Deltaproteobacteria bacterium]|nr:tetratricopeptide repeat protein [Deltaproteobacteria bacterium]